MTKKSPLNANGSEGGLEVFDFKSFDSDVLEFLFFRLEPQQYSGQAAEYLGIISGPFTEEDVRERWGGGKFRFRVRKDKKFVPGGKTFSIAGPPKDNSVPSAVPGDSSGGLIAPLMAEIKEMRETLIKSLQGGAVPASGSNRAEEFQAKLDAAMETKLLMQVLEPQPAVDPTAIGSLLLEAIQIGAERGSDGDDSGVTGRVIRMVEQLFKAKGAFSPNAGTSQFAKTPIGGEKVGPNPVRVPETTAVESNALIPAVVNLSEEETVVGRTIPERVSIAVDLMLQAIDAVRQYSSAEIADIALGSLTSTDYRMLRNQVSVDGLRSFLTGQVLLDFDSRVEEVTPVIEIVASIINNEGVSP